MTYTTTILCECPTCGAKPGNPCLTKDGHEAQVAHKPRQKRAKEIESRPKDKTMLDFPCERCGAKVGKSCKNPKGYPAESHKPRRTAFQRHLRARTTPVRGDAFEHHPDGGRRDERGNLVRALPDAWRALFLRSTLKTGFCLVLTQPMLEQLCAISDQVNWDRSVFRHSMGLASPDSPVTRSALERRGLVRHRGTRILRDEERDRSNQERHERWNDEICDVWELTPAGEQLVELLRTTGVFLEQSAATTLRARQA